jgi:hypothetical protein
LSNNRSRVVNTACCRIASGQGDPRMCQVIPFFGAKVCPRPLSPTELPYNWLLVSDVDRSLDIDK